MSLTVRPLTVADQSSLQKILDHHRSALFNWTLQQVLADVEGKHSLSLWDGPELLAWITFSVQQGGEIVEIQALASNPQRVREGHMKRLLGELVKSQPQMEDLWLEVHENNQTARNLYLKWNFKELGKRPKYYPDGGAAILMSCKINPCSN